MPASGVEKAKGRSLWSHEDLGSRKEVGSTLPCQFSVVLARTKNHPRSCQGSAWRGAEVGRGQGQGHVPPVARKGDLAALWQWRGQDKETQITNLMGPPASEEPDHKPSLPDRHPCVSLNPRAISSLWVREGTEESRDGF